MKKNIRKPKVVTIGGGTGSFTVLTGLKEYDVDLTAIVAMADNGGSTGLLRNELGVLPPGDVRQCLVALSESPQLMLDLMNYRFENGGLQGHNLGNLFLSALERVTGNFDESIDHVCDILSVRGKVVPATLDNADVVAKIGRREVKGESEIRDEDLTDLKDIFLTPRAKANPKALKAIKEADVIVVGPGSFYTSLLPNFLVDGIPEAFKRSRALKLYVTNLMNKEGHTDELTVKSHAEKMEEYIGSTFDVVIYNKELPSKALVKRYATHTGQHVLPIDRGLPKEKFVGANLLSHTIPNKNKGDLLDRTLIRHDSKKLAKTIAKLSNSREIPF